MTSVNNWISQGGALVYYFEEFAIVISLAANMAFMIS